MSINFKFQRRHKTKGYDPARPLSVGRRSGTPEDFLTRHAFSARHALREGLETVRGWFSHHMTMWMTDERCLRAAHDHLDRRTSHDFPEYCGEGWVNSSVFQFCRGLRDRLRDRTFVPGPEHVVRIPKASGAGFREITVQAYPDRVVHRAAASILRSALEPTFDRCSFGFRTGLGVYDAAATAGELAAGRGLHVWLCADIRDAFRHVDTEKLLGFIHDRFRQDRLTDYIGFLLDGSKTPGLRQGSPLSPLLLNLYLHKFLDSRWRRRHPKSPMLRYADDILVLCPSRKEARRAFDTLAGLLAPAGMTLKGEADDCVADLNKGAASFLGFDVRRRDGLLKYGVLPAAWDSLGQALRKVHGQPTPPLRARETVRGWLASYGPPLGPGRFAEAADRARAVATRLGFAEALSSHEVAHLRASASKAWAGARWSAKKRCAKL